MSHESEAWAYNELAAKLQARIAQLESAVINLLQCDCSDCKAEARALLETASETPAKLDPERIEIARCPRCGRLPRPTLMGRTICDSCGGFDVPQPPPKTNSEPK